MVDANNSTQIFFGIQEARTPDHYICSGTLHDISVRIECLSDWVIVVIHPGKNDLLQFSNTFHKSLSNTVKVSYWVKVC